MTKVAIAATRKSTTDVPDLFPEKYYCLEMCKRESIPGTPEPLHTKRCVCRVGGTTRGAPRNTKKHGKKTGPGE